MHLSRKKLCRSSPPYRAHQSRETQVGRDAEGRRRDDVEAWRLLDVLAQRWTAQESVPAKQVEDPSISVAKLWELLKTYELEHPLSSTSTNTEVLTSALTAATREKKLFSKIKWEKEN